MALLSVGVLQDCLWSRREDHNPAENARLAPKSIDAWMLVSGQSPESRAAFIFLGDED